MKSLLISSLLVCLVGSNPDYNKVCKTLRDYILVVNCCETPPPMYCAFLRPSEKRKDGRCNCVPEREIFEFPGKPCGWNSATHYSTKRGTITPCIDYKEECNVPRGTLPSSECYIGYPPPARVMHNFEDKYCNFMKEKSSGLEFLPDEMIYDVFFTCWLYDCGNRLEKPREIRNRRDKLQWCYPPILPGDKRLKYCELYTRDTNLYVATPFSPYNNPQVITPPRVTGELCALPPVCKDGYSTIDQNVYMLPWIDGTAERYYCETMCNEIGPNDGRHSMAKKCRRLPSCHVNGQPDDRYNLYQVPKCRHWCSETVSYERSHAKSNCNPIPICTVVAGIITEFPPEAYTDGNPYGHTRCIPPRDCRDSETPTTHYCTARPKPEVTAPPSTTTRPTPKVTSPPISTTPPKAEVTVPPVTTTHPKPEVTDAPVSTTSPSTVQSTQPSQQDTTVFDQHITPPEESQEKGTTQSVAEDGSQINQIEKRSSEQNNTSFKGNSTMVVKDNTISEQVIDEGSEMNAVKMGCSKDKCMPSKKKNGVEIKNVLSKDREFSKQVIKEGRGIADVEKRSIDEENNLFKDKLGMARKDASNKDGSIPEKAQEK